MKFPFLLAIIGGVLLTVGRPIFDALFTIAGIWACIAAYHYSSENKNGLE